MKNTKKAVILKLLLVYLKVTLRQLHNTLLASCGQDDPRALPEQSEAKA